jgi:hypothetical protein
MREESAQQWAEARAQDEEDLDARLRVAVSEFEETGDDAQFLDFLGVQPDEVPEVIRDVEQELESHRTGEQGDIHRRFLVTSLEVLRRQSRSREMPEK